MKNPFPEDMNEFYKEYVERCKEDLTNYNPGLCLQKNVEKGGYRFGFLLNFKIGNYVPLQQEKQFLGIDYFNRINILPPFYCLTEALGFKPQIVEFTKIKDTECHNKKGKHFDQRTTYALIVDVGKKHQYLIDPYFASYGPILKEGKNEDNTNFMRIGRTTAFKAKTRDYHSKRLVDVNEFCEMLKELKDPAKSLDMLIQGEQMYSSLNFKGLGNRLKVYYDDEKNELYTRWAIEHYLTDYKFIFTHQSLDKSGNTTAINYSLKEATSYFYSKGLVDGKTIATISDKNLKAIVKNLKKVEKINKHPRWSSLLSKKENESAKKNLLSIIDEIQESIGKEQFEKIEKNILSRTLYEYEQPKKEIIHDKKTLDKTLLNSVEKYNEFSVKKHPVDHILWEKSWKLNDISRSEKRRLRKKQREYKKEMDDQAKKTDWLNYQRKNNSFYYNRLTDIKEFSKTLKGKSVEDLRNEVNERGLDIRIGHLSMITDYLPCLLDQKKELLLEGLMDNFRTKVEARKNPLVYAQKQKELKLQQENERKKESVRKLLDMMQETIVSLDDEEKPEDLGENNTREKKKGGKKR